MVLQRRDEERSGNPPVYHPESNYMSISIHYGGSFILVPKGKYVGGHVFIANYVDAKNLTIKDVDTMCSSIGGLSERRRFYIESYDGKGFVLVQKDRDLVAQAMLFAGGCIPMPLFIDAVFYNPSQIEDNFDADVENVVREVESSIGELWPSDEEDQSYEEEAQITDDDFQFSDFVDSEVQENLADLCTNLVDDELIEEEDELEMGDDVVGSDVELYENVLSDDDADLPNFVMFDLKDIWDPVFIIGLVFVCRADFMKAINSHAIRTRRNLGFVRNDTLRVYARCKVEDCEWRINLIKRINESGFFIREYLPDHSCVPTSEVKNMSSTWLSERYLHLFKSDPKRKVEGFRLDVIRELKVSVSKDQAFRAKRLALKSLQGKPDLQYTKLWEYAEELRKTNPGSTIILGTDTSSGETRFCRFYVCFKACKEGFNSGCRPIIGVDGCHLKGPHGGVLLSAVGVDANNQIYPVAYAVVGVERSETWSWFLTVLKSDLGIIRDDTFTIMSDKQKRLINAIAEVFPGSPNRFCVMHLLNNYIKAGFRGAAYKNALWCAAKSSTMGQFKAAMIKLQQLDEKAADWLSDKSPEQWSWSHFPTNCKSDMLLNNCCESFNNSIKEARDKPIITMMEWLREHLMKKLQEGRDACLTWKGILCPRIKAIVNEHLQKVADCIPIKADDTHYQISTYDGAMYAVDLGSMTCTCRKWELSGIPCHHALSAIIKQKRDPDDYVNICYTIETYKKAYAPVIYPISGQELWCQSIFIPPMPPNFGRGVGRPRKVRRRQPTELVNHRSRRGQGRQPLMALRRQTPTVHCSSCGESGHNVRACPERPEYDQANPEAKRKRLERKGKQAKRNLFGEGTDRLRTELQRNIFGEGTSRQGTEGTKSTVIEVNVNHNVESYRAPSVPAEIQPPTGQLSQEVIEQVSTPTVPLTSPCWINPATTLPGPTMFQQLQMGQHVNLPRSTLAPA